MGDVEALGYAIFAINTLMHPDASSTEDVDDLEARASEVVTALDRLRDSLTK
jgi:hypothetical protein